MKHKEFYKDIVKTISKQSVDSRLQVGAILLKEGRIVATGYNGQLSGFKNEPIMLDGHDISTVHAEQNILCFCAKEGISTKDCIMIISHSPCQVCTKLLIQAGISKVYYLQKYRYDENPFLSRIDNEMLE